MNLRRLVETCDLEYTGRCRHKHKLGGTGAVFLQSVGILICNKCKKYQAIKKPLV